jgi:hypothetical protein
MHGRRLAFTTLMLATFSGLVAACSAAPGYVRPGASDLTEGDSGQGSAATATSDSDAGDPPATADEGGTASEFADAGPGPSVENDAQATQGPGDVPISHPPCTQACDDAGGTCTDGVCVIDCSSESCARTACPAGMPCKVLCTSDSACAKGVDCGEASSCSVVCSGANSCVGGIACAGDKCEVECSGLTACPNVIRCDAGACDVQCTGISSCGQIRCGEANRDCSVTCTALQACPTGISSEGTGTTNVHCVGPTACSGPTACVGSSCSVQCEKEDDCGAGVCCKAVDCRISGARESCPP